MKCIFDLRFLGRLDFMHVHSAFKHLIALFEPMIYKTVLLLCVEILEMISDQEQEKKTFQSWCSHETTKPLTIAMRCIQFH